MTIAIGDKLPDATLLKPGADGPEPVSIGTLLAGSKVALFGVPGAFTGVCSEAHMPSFLRAVDELKAKGVDHVICVAVNDPFVLEAWDEATGATAGGITLLGDAGSEFITAIGMNFDAPPVGFVSRSRRFSLLAEDGVVSVLNVEDSPGTCEISAGETLLAAL